MENITGILLTKKPINIYVSELNLKQLLTPKHSSNLLLERKITEVKNPTKQFTHFYAQ